VALPQIVASDDVRRGFAGKSGEVSEEDASELETSLEKALQEASAKR